MKNKAKTYLFFLKRNSACFVNTLSMCAGLSYDKNSTFYKQHFEIHILEWKRLNCNQNFTQVYYFLGLPLGQQDN